jgi:hypothetical protein
MSKRKLSAADYRALNAGRVIRSYPPDGGPARIEIPGRASRARPRREGQVIATPALRTYPGPKDPHPNARSVKSP